MYCITMQHTNTAARYRPLPEPTHVIRVDVPGTPGLRYATLTGAIQAGPPNGPEARILGACGALALAAGSMTEWLPTVEGRVRIERENLGRCGS